MGLRADIRDNRERMPVGIARRLVRNELERIEASAGVHVARDVERAIQALIDDAVETAEEKRRAAYAKEMLEQ